MAADILGRSALYRLYGRDGALLYVGITDNLSRRFWDHSREKSWWRDVDGKIVWFYDKRAEAEEAETAAIHGEDPVHNVARTAAHAEAVWAAQQRTARKRDRAAAGWSFRDAPRMYPRDCNWCGTPGVATTDDPNVFIACSDCHDFYGPPTAAVADLREKG